MENAIIRAENITKKFKTKTVLEDISFTIKRGEFLSLLAPSGCGKTTILRILIGIEKPTSGHIYKDDVDITNAPPKDRNIGIVFQNYSLFPWMTTRKNIEFGIKQSRHDIKRSERAKIADEFLTKVGLTGFGNKFPSQLSGGM